MNVADYEPPITINRVVEQLALMNMARRERTRARCGNTVVIPRHYMEVLRLERAALLFAPHWMHDDKINFIIGRTSPSYTHRDITNILNRCGDIIEFATLCDIDVRVEDYTYTDFLKLSGMNRRN